MAEGSAGSPALTTRSLVANGVAYAALATVLDSPDPASAAWAALALVATGDRQHQAGLLDDLGRLGALATARGVPPGTASELLIRVLDGLIDRFARRGDRDERDRAAADAVAVAEVALRISPKRVEPRTALALALGHQRQPLRARGAAAGRPFRGTGHRARQPVGRLGTRRGGAGQLHRGAAADRAGGPGRSGAGWVTIAGRVLRRPVAEPA